MCLNLLEITITTWSFCFIFLGIDRELLSVELKQLEACTKQSREVPLTPLEFQNVGNITNCHLFASKKVIRSCYYFTSVACKKSSSSVSSTKGFLLAATAVSSRDYSKEMAFTGLSVHLQGEENPEK